MTPIEEFEHGGCKVRIYQDDDPSSPREWSNVGEMVCWHRRANYGDRQPTEGERTALENGGWEGLVKHLKRNGATVVLPLAMLDHSGVSMWVGSGPSAFDPGGWDSGQVGFTFDTKAGREECGTPPELIEECLRDEVEAYNQYLTGDVYGYVVTPPSGRCDDEDSCWGFFGQDDVMTEAKSVAESFAKALDGEVEQVEALLARI